jgi:hypothetical protein
MVNEKNRAWQPTPDTVRPISLCLSSSRYPSGQSNSREFLTDIVGVLLLRLVAGQAESYDLQLLEGLLRRFYAEGQL